MVGGWAVMLLAVSVTVSSFTWRQHMVVVRANGTDLPTLSVRDYPGAHALLDNVKVPQLPMRPTFLEASNDLPATTTAGCISDFGNAELINCTYAAALGGGDHADVRVFLNIQVSWAPSRSSSRLRSLVFSDAA